MDYAGALGLSMLIVLFLGVVTLIVGIVTVNVAEKSRGETAGLVIMFLGGLIILSAFIGWFVAIWLGYAQGASGA